MVTHYHGVIVNMMEKFDHRRYDWLLCWPGVADRCQWSFRCLGVLTASCEKILSIDPHLQCWHWRRLMFMLWATIVIPCMQIYSYLLRAVHGTSIHPCNKRLDQNFQDLCASITLYLTCYRRETKWPKLTTREVRSLDSDFSIILWCWFSLFFINKPHISQIC